MLAMKDVVCCVDFQVRRLSGLLLSLAAPKSLGQLPWTLRAGQTSPSKLTRLETGLGRLDEGKDKNYARAHRHHSRSSLHPHKTQKINQNNPPPFSLY